MKKILIFILGVLFLPFIVNADMGIPETIQYEAIVDNKDGALLYSYDKEKVGHVDYDFTFTTLYEIDGYAAFECEISGFDDYCYISMDDISILKDKFDDFEKLYEYEEDYYVWDEGLYLYNGPSIKYSLVEDSPEIPVGTILTSIYSDNEDYPAWVYVSYEDKEGFIFVYDYDIGNIYADYKSKVAHMFEDGDFIAPGDVEIYRLPYDREPVGILNALSDVQTKYAIFKYHYSYLYVFNDSIEGWISSKKLVNKNTDYYIYLDEDTPIYSDYTLKNKLTQIIPADTELKPIYYNMEDWYDGVFYVSYKNIKGWVNVGASSSGFIGMDSINSLDADYELYQSYQGRKYDAVLKSGTEVNLKYDYFDDEGNGWYFVFDKNGNALGWINDSNESIDYEVPEEFKEVAIEEPETSKPKEEKEDKKVTEEFKETKKKLSSKEILLYSVFGAIIICICAIVTIILVNKKKIKKQSSLDLEEENIPIDNKEE